MRERFSTSAIENRFIITHNADYDTQVSTVRVTFEGDPEYERLLDIEPYEVIAETGAIVSGAVLCESTSEGYSCVVYMEGIGKL